MHIFLLKIIVKCMTFQYSYLLRLYFPPTVYHPLWRIGVRGLYVFINKIAAAVRLIGSLIYTPLCIKQHAMFFIYVAWNFTLLMHVKSIFGVFP